MSAADCQRRWRERVRKGVMAVTINIDRMVINELVRRRFLNGRQETYSRDEVRGALEQALRVWSTYE